MIKGDIIGRERAHSYKLYRQTMEDPDVRTQGMETEGLGEEEFDAACIDSRSALIAENDQVIPLAVSIEHMPYLNKAYLGNVVGGSGESSPELYYYNHLAPHLLANTDEYLESMEPLLRRIAGKAGALITDHVHFDKLQHDRDLRYIAARLGYKVVDLLARQKPPVQHYQYASLLLASDPRRVRDVPFGLIDGYRDAQSRGELDESSNIKVYDRLSQEDIEYVWSYYSPAFGELDVTDPVLSGFNEVQFCEVMQDERFVKIVHRFGGKNIANLALLANLDACPWINEAYFRLNFPEEYSHDQIIVSPGIIADPAAQSKLSLGTIGMVRQLAEFTGGEPVLTFICDEVSNQQVPGLSHAGLNRSDALLTDFSYPRARQLFRVFQFERIAS